MRRRTILAVIPLAAGPFVSTAPTSAAEGTEYRFENITEGRGLSIEDTFTWGATWVDYDNDDDPDLVVNRHWLRPYFYVNANGFYARLREDFYPELVDRHGCAWGEADGDGRPDLYCGVGADKGVGSGKNQLLLQKESGFVDAAEEYGVTDEYGRARTVQWLDLDSDGDLDIFVGNKFRDGQTNVTFFNEGASFETRDVGLSHALNTQSSSWADWDRDGDPDLMVFQHRSGLPAAYLNLGGHFQRIQLANITDFEWKAGSWGDYDGDGWPDLHLISRKHSRVVKNLGGTFLPVDDRNVDAGRMSVWLDVENDGDLDLFLLQGAEGEGPQTGSTNHPDFLLVNAGESFNRVRDWSFRGRRRGNGDAVATADHDRDGRMDLFVTNGHNPSTWRGDWSLLRNVTEGGNWVGLDLEGDKKNPWGMGARVHVIAGQLDFWRHVTDGFSYRSQSEVGFLSLGIGAAEEATVLVEWPQGVLDCLTLAAGEIARLRQGTEGCP